MNRLTAILAGSIIASTLGTCFANDYYCINLDVTNSGSSKSSILLKDTSQRSISKNPDTMSDTIAPGNQVTYKICSNTNDPERSTPRLHFVISSASNPKIASSACMLDWAEGVVGPPTEIKGCEVGGPAAAILAITKTQSSSNGEPVTFKVEVKLNTSLGGN